MSKPHSTMFITTAVATLSGRAETARELAGQVSSAMGTRPVDLMTLFSSAHFEDELESIAAELQELLRPRAFIGVTAEAVISDDQEYEHQPALALWAAHLPGVGHTSFHLSQEDVQRLTSPEMVRDQLGVGEEDAPYFVLLGDPFSINPLDLLERLQSAYPGRPTIGGMASAGEKPNQNVLVFDGQTLRAGLVGVALWGNIHIDTVVSQGCRPIGRHMLITKAEKNVIHTIGGRPALTVVKEMFENDFTPQDQKLVQASGLLVGRVINEYQPSFNRGDFLIRNPIGFDPDSGAMAVNDLVRTGQTIQFHVRDRETAADDLAALLAGSTRQAAAGALLFSCNGRGTRLFRDRHHDARAIGESFGRIPVAGFFCAGEIGPIGQRNFLHGHTASIGLLRPADGATSG